jgi:hypothetical protein
MTTIDLKTTAMKGNDGWRVDSTTDLSPTHVLTFTTARDSRGDMATRATVSRREGNFMVHALNLTGHGASGDFYQYLQRARYPRVTEKVAVEHHNQVLRLHLDTVLAHARAHYKLEASAHGQT